MNRYAKGSSMRPSASHLKEASMLLRKEKGGKIRKVFKPIWVSASLPLTFALLGWELDSFLFPLTSLSRTHTMITQPRLHDITASLNAQGRIVLKLPHDYMQRASFQPAPAAQLVSTGETKRISKFLTEAGKHVSSSMYLCIMCVCVCAH